MRVVNDAARGKPGRWILDYRDQNGKRHREHFASQKAAKAAMVDRAMEVKTSTYRAPSELPTLRELSLAWLAAKSLEGLRPSTVAGYENHVHDHVVPALGHKRVDLVTLSRGLSPFSASGSATRIPGCMTT
jgi:hypothetical protein